MSDGLLHGGAATFRSGDLGEHRGEVLSQYAIAGARSRAGSAVALGWVTSREATTPWHVPDGARGGGSAEQSSA